LAPPEAAVHRKRPGNPEVPVAVDVCMVLIELYGRAVWGSCMGELYGELYGGAVYWSCM